MALAFVAGCDDVSDMARMATSTAYDAKNSPLDPEVVAQLDELTVQYGVVESGNAKADFYKDADGKVIDQKEAIHQLILEAGCEDASSFDKAEDLSDPMYVTSDVRVRNCTKTAPAVGTTADNR